MRIQLTPGTSLTSIEGKSVLFSVKTGESYGLNETAAEMLKHGLEGGIDHAVAWFVQNYDVPAEEIRGDLDELARDLERVKMARMVAD